MTVLQVSVLVAPVYASAERIHDTLIVAAAPSQMS